MIKTLKLSGVAVAALIAAGAANAQDVECPIKVGVLHSLSGTMAISETTLKDISRIKHWHQWHGCLSRVVK